MVNKTLSSSVEAATTCDPQVQTVSTLNIEIVMTVTSSSFSSIGGASWNPAYHTSAFEAV
jgi:hypothetical protein